MCVMIEPDQYWTAWRKSSYSGGNGGQCVEVGAAERSIAVRDSKNPGGFKLLLTFRVWHEFTSTIKCGTYDL